MSERQPTPSLEQAVQAAHAEVGEQQRQAERIAASKRPRIRIQRYLLAALVAAGGALAYVQTPRILEPYGVPDPTQQVEVAVADLEALATFVEAFRVARGRYPERLDEVNLPEVWKAFVSEGAGPRYRRTDNAFVLDWPLPRWHVVHDGASGDARINPPS